LTAHGGSSRRSGLWFAAVTILTVTLSAGAAAVTQDHGHKSDDHKHHDDEAHVHAQVPAEYKKAHVPAAAWTDRRMIARGKEIYATRCAVCHGDDGDGKGPAGMILPLRPPDLRDRKMVGEMASNYWFWRISEGGAVEPFKSMGSAMPAWRAELSVEDRWAVIAYQHTFSGHEGPHVVSEHAELGMAGHGQGPTPAGAKTAPATGGPGHKR
jgi:mono/diheme cytochrome c family protein